MNEVSDSSTDPRKKNVPYSNVAVVRDTVGSFLSLAVVTEPGR